MQWAIRAGSWSRGLLSGDITDSTRGCPLDLYSSFSPASSNYIDTFTPWYMPNRSPNIPSTKPGIERQEQRRNETRSTAETGPSSTRKRIR